MKKNKNLYYLAVMIIVMMGITLIYLQKKIPIYHIKNAICLDEKTLLINESNKKRKIITKNKILIYQKKKITYEVTDITKDLLTIKIQENICQQKIIEIKFFNTKKKIMHILLESWKKDEENK